jgi:hypothetical protein
LPFPSKQQNRRFLRFVVFFLNKKGAIFFLLLYVVFQGRKMQAVDGFFSLGAGLPETSIARGGRILSLR